MKKDKAINTLVIADTHNTLTYGEIQKYAGKNIDLILILGDIGNEDWKILFAFPFFIQKDKFGVLGNHDNQETYTYINKKLCEMNGKPITHLHGIHAEFSGLTFAGLDGSIKYKNGNYLMYTQKEAMDIIKQIPSADILVSHSNPKYNKDLSNTFSDSSHDGLYAISYFLKTSKCQLNIHGHVHNIYRKKSEISCFKVCFLVLRKNIFNKIKIQIK